MIICQIPWFWSNVYPKLSNCIRKSTIEDNTDTISLGLLVDKLPDVTDTDWNVDFNKLINEVHLIKEELKRTLDKGK